MIQISDAPMSSNKKYVVEIDFFDLPTSWGHEKREFDTWEQTISYVNRCHRREQRLRRFGKLMHLLKID